MTVRLSQIIWVFLAVPALWSAQVDACSCTRRSVETAFDNAKHVFVARIERVELVAPPRNGDDRWEPQRASFSMRDALKGKPNRIKRLRTGYGYGDCGVPLIVGADYLVLANDHGRISLCSGYFGPHFGFVEDGLDDDEPRPWRNFIESVRKHYSAGSAIERPPSPAYGVKDASFLWFPLSE
ncbi:MAG: hypothetical protein J0L88_04905 [Xanthomonadales bacterium]|nr:hypothetical protein [Xanthomonadales bacterium]